MIFTQRYCKRTGQPCIFWSSADAVLVEYERADLVWCERNPGFARDGRVFVKGSGEVCPKVHRSFSWKFSGSPVLAEVIQLIDHLERICSCVSVTPHLIHSPQWDSIIIGNRPFVCWLITVSLSCRCGILLAFWSQKRIATIYAIELHMYRTMTWSTLHVQAWRKC